MIKIGATTLPLAGWLADPRHPEQSRSHRLASIRRLVEDYYLPAVELTLDFGAVFPQVFDGGFYAAVADLQQELGFTCTVHLPFLWLDPSSLNEPLRQTSADCLCRCAELTRPVDVETYVLHLWGRTTAQVAIVSHDLVEREAILGSLLAQVERSLDQVCQVVDPRDLCVENLEDPFFDSVAPLLEKLGVSICLDVGHLAWRGDGALDFWAQYGHRIREVHLHDAIGPSPDGASNRAPERRVAFRDHLPLGQGHVDYVAFVRKLEEDGYEGAVILENNTKADLEESLQRVGAWL